MTGAARRRLGVAGLVAAAALVVAHGYDGWAVTALSVPSANDRDWGRLLRILGFAPTWLLVAILLWLESRGRDPERAIRLRSTALALVAAIAIGGLGAEGIKLLVRRLRPDPAIAGYQFRPFSVEPWRTSRLGFPSSHAMVAFAAATVLARRFRRAAPVLFALAAGAGLTRVFARAHFLSDVVGAAIGGVLVGHLTGRWLERPRLHGRPG